MNNRLIKNASWIIICKVVQSILSLVIGTLTARYLGPSNYGLINYAASIVAFVIPIMQLGFRNTLVRDIVDNPEEEGKILGTTLGLNMISAVCCIFGVTFFTCIANKGEKETIIVCALYSLNLLFQALEMVQYWFQAKLLSKYHSVVSVVAYFVISLYRIYLLVTGKNIYWFALSQALDYMIISVSLVVVYRKISKQKLEFSMSKGREMFSISKHYIVSSMMVAIFGYIGNILLKFLIDEKAVGYYTVAITCTGITSFVFAAVIDSARPVILECKNKNEELYKERIIQLYSVIIAITLLQSVCITIFAGFIVKILYGAQYVSAVVPLQIYTWQTVFSQLGTIRNIWILAEGKQKYLWIINAGGAIFSIIMNFALIPVLGPSGAALAAVFTQLFTNVIIGFILKPIRGNQTLLLKSLDFRILYNMIKSNVKFK